MINILWMNKCLDCTWYGMSIPAHITNQPTHILYIPVRIAVDVPEGAPVVIPEVDIRVKLEKNGIGKVIGV